jgi:hypothetical protein
MALIASPKVLFGVRRNGAPWHVDPTVSGKW